MENNKNFENEIKQFFEKHRTTAIKSKVLSKHLKIESETDYSQLKEDLNNLYNDGFLSKNGKRYKYNNGSKNIVGTLQVTRNGFGFVIQINEAEKDIFILKKNLGDALDGDKVLVKIMDDYSGKSPRGEIVKVLERGKTEFVGKLKKHNNDYFIIAENKTNNIEIKVPASKIENAKENDLVIVSIDDTEGRAGKVQGKVIEVLGKAGEHVSDMLGVAHNYSLKTRFAKEVLNEVEIIDKSLTDEEIEGRKDFRDKLVFTIDPQDAKDFDDAISIEKVDRDTYLIGVHIADVSYFVKENSKIDLEAKRRGTSVYLVNYVIPMLPEELTNNLCSLVENQDRLCYSVLITITSRGTLKNYEFAKTVIKSKRRFTYEEVDEILDSGNGDFASELKLVYKISEKLLAKRIKSGSLDFDNEEIKIKLDKVGKTIRITPKERLKSNRLIEEFMLLANKLVAAKGVELEEEKKLPFIYRIHDNPDETKISNMVQFAAHLGYKLNATGAIKNKHLQSLLEQVKGNPEEKLINMEMIRAMAKAVYSTKNIGHYGLAFDKYTHFTSPIRRYPDLMVHRLLWNYLTAKSMKKKKLYTEENLDEICKANSNSERVAAEAEREAIKVKVLQFLKDKTHQIFSGIVTGVQHYGIFVELSDFFVEGLIRVDDMPSDVYLFDEKNYTLTGKISKISFRIGDKVVASITKINFEKREMDLELIKKTENF